MKSSIRIKFAMVLGLLAVAVITAGFGAVLALRSTEGALSRLREQRLRVLLMSRDANANFKRFLSDFEVTISTNDEQILADDGQLIADIHRRLQEARRSEILDELAKLQKESQSNFDLAVRDIDLVIERTAAIYLVCISSLTLLAVGISTVILRQVLRRIRALGVHFAGTDLEKITPMDTEQQSDELSETINAANRMLLGIKESRRQLVDKELLDSIVESLVDMLLVVDTSGRIVKVNGVSVMLIGRSAAELEGRNIGDFLVRDERTQHDSSAEVLAKVLSGKTVTDEVSLRNATGQLIPIAISAAPLSGKGLDRAAAVLVARDLRARLEDEARMRRIQGQLAQAGKLASLGTLGAGVAHELNNPLTAVRGYADLITRTAGTPAEVLAQASKIIAASDRMRKIVDHLRIFSTDTSGHQHRLVDINKVVDDSLILLQNQIVQRGIEVEVSLGTGLGAVKADANHLESVVQNLIANARDALGELPDDRLKKIRVTTKAEGTGTILVTVEDNANGIKEEVRSRIFDPFFTTKEIGKGTGLGLSIAHAIAKEHKGELTFTTVMGKGTCFTLKLPRVEAVADPVPAASGVEPPKPGKKPRLVVIDDEEMIGEYFETALGDVFDITYFNSPGVAVARLAVIEYDLIVTGMAMPGMDGLEVIKRVKRMDPNAKIVVITGHARSPAILASVHALGGLDILPKPFPPADVLVRQLLQFLNDRAVAKSA